MDYEKYMRLTETFRRELSNLVRRREDTLRAAAEGCDDLGFALDLMAEGTVFDALAVTAIVNARRAELLTEKAKRRLAALDAQAENPEG